MAKHSSLPSPDMIPRRRATPPPSPEAVLIGAQPEPAPTPVPIPPPTLPEPMVSATQAAQIAVPARAPVAAAPAPAAPVEEGRVRALRGKTPHRKIGVRLDRERYQRLKRYAVDHGLSVEEIAIAALDRYLGDRNAS